MYWLLLAILIPYLIILLRIYRSILKIKPWIPDHNKPQFISIITACRNEENNLPVLLGDISAQDYPPGMYEVIVIDDNSSDSTFRTASDFKGISNLKVIKNNGTGKKAAIRTGTGIAEGNLVITVDADCRIKKKWLMTIASFHFIEKADMIICPVLPDEGRGFFNRFQELEFMSLQGITAGSAAAGDPLMCNGANLSFTMESFDRYGRDLHDELISGDDVFLLHNMKREKGNKILWLESEDAAVTTAGMPSLMLFLSQRARWISKAGAYRDNSTKIAALATLAAIILQLGTLMAGIWDTAFLAVSAAAFMIKSVPDYLILKNRTMRYGRYSLMKWFIPSQLIYPFYVIAVIFYLLTGWKGFVNYPYQKGT